MSELMQWVEAKLAAAVRLGIGGMAENPHPAPGQSLLHLHETGHRLPGLLGQGKGGQGILPEQARHHVGQAVRASGFLRKTL